MKTPIMPRFTLNILLAGVITLTCFSSSLNANTKIDSLYNELSKGSNQEAIRIEIGKAIISESTKGNNKVDLKQIQKSLAEESRIIFYITKCNIYGLLLNRTETIIYRINKRAVEESQSIINIRTSQFLKERYSESMEDFIKPSRKLYELLLAPIKEKLKHRVSIYAPSYLVAIPWDALIVERKEGIKYMIHYHEVNILQDLEVKTESRGEKDIDIIGVAPEFQTTMFLGNKEEQDNISGGFSKKLLSGKVSKSMVMNSIINNAASIIHFSSHAEIDKDNWLCSGILLSEKDRLDVYTIREMKIDAELVFLNTCKSAHWMESHNHKETITGAFLEAGARSVIGTLWRIEDQVAKEMAENIYIEIKKGKRIGVALREAKLKYISETKLKSKKHPYHWGAYQLYGENKNIANLHIAKMKRMYSLVFSFLTTLSMLSYYFGDRIRSEVNDWNWI